MNRGRSQAIKPTKCPSCKKLFKNKKHPRSIYCSRKCYYTSRKGKQPSKENLEKLRSKKANKKRSESLEGIKRSLEWRKKASKRMRGSKCNFWKGGRSNFLHKLRQSLDYKLWREKVFIRDDFTCQECNQRGGKLEAHHLLSFSKYPKLRFIVENGLTLCKKCHKKTDSYLKRYD